MQTGIPPQPRRISVGSAEIFRLCDVLEANALGAHLNPPDACPTVVFCMHFLGGSGRGWDAVAARLPASVRAVTIDLPGFGDSAAIAGYSVAEMSDFVADTIRREAAPCWMLAGHSMGAKVAAVIARRAEDGDASLAGLQHLLLLAGSPPSPEPMQEDRRSTMTEWFGGDEASRREQADGFIAENAGQPLASRHHALAVNDVLRANRAAWTAWLEQGSREDWSDFVGTLRTPATIVSGAKDGDLGPDAQIRLMAPHFHDHDLVVLAGAGHLLPLECADDVAQLIERCAARASLRAELGTGCWDLLHSKRVSRATRQAMLDRARPSDRELIAADFGATLEATLRAMLSRVVPQDGETYIDLAAALITEIASTAGDGWRYAALPPDRDAYRAGLRTLDAAARAVDGQDFASLAPREQDAILSRAAAGDLDAAAPEILSASQMKLWFEDVRASATRAYVGHPATLWRLGFSGLACAGDGPRKSGFTQFGIGIREDWEPASPPIGRIR